MKTINENLWRAVLFSLATTLMVTGVTTSASAGIEIDSVHRLKLKLRAMYEVDRDGGGTREKRSYLYGKEIAGICLGREAERHERLAIGMECGNPGNNAIFIVDLEDENILRQVGFIEIISTVIRETNSDGTRLRDTSFLGYLEIECEDEGYEADIEIQVPIRIEQRDRDGELECAYRGFGKRTTGRIAVEVPSVDLDINGVIRKGRVEIGRPLDWDLDIPL